MKQRPDQLRVAQLLCEYAGDVAIAYKFAVVEIGTIYVICWLNNNRAKK